MAVEAKNTKTADGILLKIAPNIAAADALKAHPNFYLLHEQTTKHFNAAYDECIALQTTCKDMVAANGQGPFDVDAKTASEKCIVLKKHAALLNQMLSKLSTAMR